jgi:hypothetical protein
MALKLNRFWFIFLTGFIACGNPKETNKFSDTDAEESRLSLPVLRFEEDLFGVKKENFTADTQKLHQKYRSFFYLFTEKIIKVGGPESALLRENLLGFLNDPDILSVKSEVKKQFPELTEEQKKLELGFSRFHELFPDSVIPQLVTMLSGFNYNIALSDSALAIGLDMYLGETCRYYELLAIPKYKVRNMTRKQLVPDAIRGYLLGNFEMKSPVEDLISWMIYHGKILYLAEQLLPESEEQSIFGSTEAQLNWCKEHEGKIWGHFIDRKLFYSTDFKDQVNYINDGPFTPGFPEESPARIGVWLGWQLVKSYMEKNGNTSIPQLMKLQDAHQIFNKSGYKPIRL